MKKFVLPVGAGVVVFGVVTAFAASLNLTSSGLSAGNATVAACDSAASVTYATALVGDAFEVTSATVTTGSATGCDGLNFKVALSGTDTVPDPDVPVELATSDGTDSITDDTGTVDFSGDHILAEDVTGVAVIVTG